MTLALSIPCRREGSWPRGIWGSGGLTPGAVRPDHIEAVVLKRGDLRVGDVGFAVFLNEDATGGGNSLGPAKIEHPADGVEHVNAHVTHEAVAVFHERCATSGGGARVRSRGWGWAANRRGGGARGRSTFGNRW